MRGCALSDALVGLLPGAVVTRRREHDWHSATFSGKRLELTLQTPGPVAAGLIAEQEFALPGQLVADVVVVSNQATPEGTFLIVEALLLDEDGC